ncbi:MAG: hypothetical protein WBC85_11755 [Planktotalea sp.]|uniref:hypothetical protein n=1 Tax=Planktotalea sp. TaxID=2029877 RepID=UPI003C71176B
MTHLNTFAIFPMRLPNPIPSQRDKPYLIDPIAFAGALVGAPLLVAVLGFWAFLVPVGALIFGGPLYLLLGTPALLILLPRRKPRALEIAGLAFVVNLFATALIGLVGLLSSSFDLQDFLVLYGGLGSIMAPIWGTAFAMLYVSLESATYKVFNA